MQFQVLFNEISSISADLTVFHSNHWKKLLLYAGSTVEPPVGDGAVSYSSEEVSHTTRRQMYITAANSRMECMEVHSVYQFDNLSFDGSHESFDTIDNEGYSTDTSFIDQVKLDFV